MSILTKHNLSNEDFELIKNYNKKFNSDYNKLQKFMEGKFGKTVSDDIYNILLEIRNQEIIAKELAAKEEKKIIDKQIKKEKLNIKIIKIAVIILLTLALLKLPYGYYTFLRIIVTGVSIYLAYLYYEEENKIFTYIFSFIALLFNPLIPIYLSKSIWNVFDVLVAIFYFISIFIGRKTLP